MEAKGPNGNHTAFQGWHAERSLENWPDSGLPVCLGTTIWLVKSPAEHSQDPEELLNQCAARGRGREKMGWLWDGHANPTAASVPINAPARAKCAAASCGQLLPWINTTQPPPPSAIWSPGCLSAFWVFLFCFVFRPHRRHGIAKSSPSKKILQNPDPILPQDNTHLPV